MSDKELDNITPVEIDEPDDPETAVNEPEDPQEYLDWDREQDGLMSDHATDVEDEPACQSGDDAEKGE